MAEPRAVLAVPEEEVPEPVFARARAKLVEHPRVGHASSDLVVERAHELRLDRHHLALHEGADAGAKLLRARSKIEGHCEVDPNRTLRNGRGATYVAC